MKRIAYSLAAATSLIAGTAQADEITLRIGSGHPPGVVYAGLMIDYFQPELKREYRSKDPDNFHTIRGLPPYCRRFRPLIDPPAGRDRGDVSEGR